MVSAAEEESRRLGSIYEAWREWEMSPQYRYENRVSVPQMVRMSFQDGEPAIQLLELEDTREFMGNGHLAE